MSLSATYTVASPIYSATSGGNLSATQTITYVMTGDGSSSSFSQNVFLPGVTSMPSSVSATITKQQTSGLPKAWQKSTVYALNTIIGASNGTLQQATTAGTSFGAAWIANATYTANQQVFDPYGNVQTCTVGGTTGTSLPTNFTPNMTAGTQTQDNGVTWTCAGNAYPNFSSTTGITTTDNSVVWTCEGTNSVVAGYDAPSITPSLSGSTLTLSFGDALKAPGTQVTDSYGNTFIYSTWLIVVTLNYSFGSASNVPTTTWTSATTVNTALELPLAGTNGIQLSITNTGTVSGGAVTFQVSSDGTNWFVTQGTLAYGFQWVEQAWSLVGGNITLQFNTAGYSYFRAILTTAITGSGSSTLVMQTITQPVITSVVVGQPFGQNNHVTLDDATSGSTANVSVKGTQGTNALNVQQFKDSGRTPVVLYLDSIAGVTTEALATMNINKGGTTSTATSYTVTAGKTLRVQTMFVSVRASSAAMVSARARLRAASTVSATSPVFCLGEASSLSATTAAANAEDVTIPDGLEFAGGQQVGISQIATATTADVTVLIIGYEY